jgi:hypothetical protein
LKGVDLQVHEVELEIEVSICVLGLLELAVLTLKWMASSSGNSFRLSDHIILTVLADGHICQKT